jgi:Pyridine nucleotide-disulphide oxidoreductase, dimerisation domain
MPLVGDQGRYSSHARKLAPALGILLARRSSGWFQHSPRAQIAGSTQGLIKLVFRRDDRRLLGVHILGELAEELIHQGQAAIASGERIDSFIDRTFNIPTYSETYKYAAYDGLQRLQGRSHDLEDLSQTVSA